MSAPSHIADDIEALATSLRGLASAWCASGQAPALSINGTDCAISALSYIDLIDDASALEADALKLRTLFH